MNVMATSEVYRVQSSDQETVHEVFVSLCVHSVRENCRVRTTMADKFATVNLPGGGSMSDKVSRVPASC
jgi:hypothetical protein